MGLYYLCLCLLFITNLDAKSFELAPVTTKTITVNGNTHEISRHMVVPNAKHNGNINRTIAKAIKLLTARKNGVDEAQYEINNDNSGSITNQRVASTSNKKIVKVRNNLIKKLQKIRARGNAGSKFTETPVLNKYLINLRSLSDSYNDSDHEVLRKWNTEKSNGRGTVKHTKVTFKVKTLPTVSKSKVIFIKNIIGKRHKANLNKALKFITKNKLERGTSDSGIAEMNDLITKRKMIATLGINKLFTIPGKKGRFKLLYEENDDSANDDHEIHTIHDNKYITYQQTQHFVTSTGGSAIETNLDENIKNNNLTDGLFILNSSNGDDIHSIVGETTNDTHGSEVVTGEMKLPEEAPENKQTDTQISSEITTDESILNNAPALNVNDTNSFEKHNTKPENAKPITVETDVSNNDHNQVQTVPPVKKTNTSLEDNELHKATDSEMALSEENLTPTTVETSVSNDDNYNQVQTVPQVKETHTTLENSELNIATNPEMVLSEENTTPITIETTVSNNDHNQVQTVPQVKETNTNLEKNELNISTGLSPEVFKNRYTNIYPESEENKTKPISVINSTTTTQIGPIESETNFRNNSSALRDITDEYSTADVNIKPSFKEMENINDVQIESSSATSDLYKPEKPKIDVEPTAELLDNGNNITKTDTTLIKTAKMPSKINDSNKYSDLIDDNQTAALGIDNKLENKVKPIPKDIKEPDVDADVSENSDDVGNNNITGTAKNLTINIDEPESGLHNTNKSEKLEKEVDKLVTDIVDKENTVELPSDNSETEKLQINYTVPDANSGFGYTQELNSSMSEQATLTSNFFKYLTERRYLNEALKSLLDVVKQLDDFYYNIHLTTTGHDNINNHKLKPSNHKLDTPSEAFTDEIKQENNIESSQYAQPITNVYNGGKEVINYYESATPKRLRIQINDRDNKNIEPPIAIRIPSRIYRQDYNLGLPHYINTFKPYRNFKGYIQNAYLRPNQKYRNPYAITDRYFQKIYKFLTSKNVMQLLRLKYEIGYGDIDKIRKSHIIEQVRKLGFNISPRQLYSLNQLVRQLEFVNIDNQNNPSSVVQYYNRPYANIYPMQPQSDAYIQYPVPNVDVNFNTVISALLLKAINLAKYMRIRGVPEYQISLYLTEVHRNLNNIAVQSYLNDCKAKIVTGLSIKLDSLVRQAMMI